MYKFGSRRASNDAATDSTQQAEHYASNTGLLRGGVGFIGGLAQSVGLLGPSAAIGLVVSGVVGVVGPLAWVSWVIGIVGISFVAYAVVFLSRRFVGTGGLFPLAGKAAGTPAGYFTAYGALLWLLAAAPVVIIQTGIFFASFLALPAFGIAQSNSVVFIVSLVTVFAAGWIAYSGVRLSTAILLCIEGITILAIVLLLIITLIVHQGGIIDSAEFNIKGSDVGSIFTGLALVIFAFGGFESATVLGQEVRKGRRNISLAVVGSIVVAGLLFIVATYIAVLGFSGTHYNIGASGDALAALAQVDGVSWLGYIIALALVAASFAVNVALYNAGSRLLFTLPREGLPGVKWLQTISPKRRTPVAGILIFFVVNLAVVIIVGASGLSPVSVFDNLGTLSGYGAAIMYLVTALAVFYLVALKTRKALFAAVISLLGAAVIGYGLYKSLVPLPPYPTRTFVWIFVATAACVAVGLLFLKVRHTPAFIGQSVDEDTKSADEQ